MFSAASKISRMISAVTLVVSIVLPAVAAGSGASPGALPVNLNLSSTHKTVSAPATATINLSGHPSLIVAGSRVTPAEAAAIAQVLSTGTQSIKLGIAGSAVGGSFVIPGNELLSSLVIPSGLKVLRDFNGSSTLSITGSLLNSGSFYAVSTNSATSLATISAADLTNNHGALITTVLPPGGLTGFSNATTNLSLSLLIADKIINAGTISSAGDLNLIASKGSLFINSTGGTLSAVNNINILSPNAGKNDVVALAGGNLISSELNVDVARGTINLFANQITGLVNVTACNAHVGSMTGPFNMGVMNVTGDPTYFSGGDFPISAPLNALAGQSVVILAGGDVIITPPAGTTLPIEPGSPGKFQNITIVAGAKLSFIAPATASSPTPITAGSIKVTGASDTGGGIYCTGCNATTNFVIDTANSGGNIFLAAYAFDGVGPQKAQAGSITLTGGTLNTSNTIGKAGNVTIIAPNNIVLCTTTMIGSGKAPVLTVENAQPTGTLTATNLGKTIGSLSAQSGTGNTGTIGMDFATVINVSSTGTNTPGGTINMVSGSDMTIDGELIANASNGKGGSINLTARSSSLFMNGSLNADGGVGAAGGTISLLSPSTSGIFLGGGGTNVTADGGTGFSGNPGTDGSSGKPNGTAGGAAGVGGPGGTIIISGHNIDWLSTQVVADGGNGGSGGFGANGLGFLASIAGNAGNGGAGGAGGAAGAGGKISLITTQIQLNGATQIKTAGGTGGAGGAGGNGGTSTGGSGGNGGKAGKSGAGGSGGKIFLFPASEIVHDFTGALTILSDGGSANSPGLGGNGGAGISKGGNGGAGGAAGAGGKGGTIAILFSPKDISEMMSATGDLFSADGANAGLSGLAGFSNTTGTTTFIGGSGGAGGAGASGGKGGSVTVNAFFNTLAAIKADGGQGSSGQDGTIGATGKTAGNAGSGGQGGSGGKGGTLTLTGSGPELTGLNIIGPLSAQGGTAGNGGSGADESGLLPSINKGSAGGKGASGGTGGAGGTINLNDAIDNVDIDTSLITTSINASGRQGGNGGGGGAGSAGATGGGTGGSSGSGGKGGAGGTVSISASQLLVSATVDSNLIFVNGGNGGTTDAAGAGGSSSGAAGGAGGNAGNGGAGGVGGTVKVTATQNSTTAMGLDFGVNARGGNGGDNANNVIASITAGGAGGSGLVAGKGGNNGNGGTGGKGGTVTLTSTGTAAVENDIEQVDVTGGDGGNALGDGGKGGANLSTHGNGGNGGNAGKAGVGAVGGTVKITTASSGLKAVSTPDTAGLNIVADGGVGGSLQGNGGNGGSSGSSSGSGGNGGNASIGALGGAGGSITITAAKGTVDATGTTGVLQSDGGGGSESINLSGTFGGSGGPSVGNGGKGGASEILGGGGSGGKITVAASGLHNLPQILAIGNDAGTILGGAINGGAGSNTSTVSAVGGKGGALASAGNGGHGGTIALTGGTGGIVLNNEIDAFGGAGGSLTGCTTGIGGNTNIGTGKLGAAGATGIGGSGGAGGSLIVKISASAITTTLPLINAYGGAGGQGATGFDGGINAVSPQIGTTGGAGGKGGTITGSGGPSITDNNVISAEGGQGGQGGTGGAGSIFNFQSGVFGGTGGLGGAGGKIALTAGSISTSTILDEGGIGGTGGHGGSGSPSIGSGNGGTGGNGGNGAIGGAGGSVSLIGTVTSVTANDNVFVDGGAGGVGGTGGPEGLGQGGVGGTGGVGGIGGRAGAITIKSKTTSSGLGDLSSEGGAGGQGGMGGGADLTAGLGGGGGKGGNGGNGGTITLLGMWSFSAGQIFTLGGAVGGPGSGGGGSAVGPMGSPGDTPGKIGRIITDNDAGESDANPNHKRRKVIAVACVEDAADDFIVDSSEE